MHDRSTGRQIGWFEVGCHDMPFDPIYLLYFATGLLLGIMRNASINFTYLGTCHQKVGGGTSKEIKSPQTH